MIVSITQFTQPFEHKTIAQLFSDEQANSNEAIYQSIILLLACDSQLINQNFVKDWIYFTNSLKKQLLDVEVKLKRISMVGTQTTYQLLQESQPAQNIQPILILDQIQKLQQIKNTKIPNFDFIQLEAAKFQSAQNIIQTEKFLQQLKEYHTNLLNCSQLGTSSFQLQSQDDFQDFQNYNQPLQQQQQIQNIITLNSKNNDKV